MENRISEEYIISYLLANYGQIKHDPKKLAFAIRKTANKYNLNKIDLFHFLIEQKNTIPYAMSYGFQTSFGRKIIEEISYIYNN
jgi:hypothetical protein